MTRHRSVPLPVALIASDMSRYRPKAIRWPVQESAPTIERLAVREAAVGGVETARPGRMLCRLIRAGVSLNGNAYPPAVLRRAAESRAWAAGCPTFVDHATDAEEEARPAGSIRNLAGVLAEDARWDEASQSLVAEVRLFEPWRATLTDMAEHIGMSIRAWVTGEHGEYEGRRCFVVSGIEAGRSVDFVTAPAAGGGIVSILEAVGNVVPAQEARNCGHWFEARIHAGFTELADRMFGDGYLTRPERIALSSAIGDGLAAFAARVEADVPHLYERDPWQEPEPTEPAMTAESTSTSDTTPDLTSGPNVTAGTPPAGQQSDPEEEPVMSGDQTGSPPVQAGTVPVPDGGQQPPTPTVPDSAPQPASPPAPAEPAQEAAAVNAAVLAAMEALTRQVTALSARADAAEAAARTVRNQQQAREAVAAALADSNLPTDLRGQIAPRITAQVLADIPITTTGDVDTTRLGESVTSAITAEAGYVAAVLESRGVGLPSGLGTTTTSAATTAEAFEGTLTEAFKALGMSEQRARLAATGRVR